MRWDKLRDVILFGLGNVVVEDIVGIRGDVGI